MRSTRFITFKDYRIIRPGSTGVWLWVLFFAVWACIPVAGAQSGRHFALLIGIGNYPAEGGWQTIHAQHDIQVMTEALQKRGFSSENILVLRDQQATRAGILKAWRDDLLPRIKAGDVVYFQFSGHGQQVADDNGDELDGFDEAIVPYDSPQRFQPGVYQGENLIRDDELNRLYTDLRRRLGPEGNLMVVVDACHSGTSTRGMGPARGAVVRMASPEYEQAIARNTGNNSETTQLDSAAANPAQLAPMAAFFGSAHNQLNYETTDEQGQFIGPLSYALSRVFTRADAATTYRGLFDQVRTDMSATAPRQQPQAEGVLDQELLGGRLLEPAAYFRVMRWNDPRSVVVDAGWVQGLAVGARIGLFPAETRAPERATPLANGTVQSVSPFEATLELDTDIREAEARQAWAYLLEQNLGNLHIGLSVQLPEQHPFRTALSEKLARYPVIRTDSTPELFLLPSGPGALLVGPADLMLDSLGGAVPPAQAADALLRRMLAYSQAKYLRKMEAESKALQLTLELIPVRPNPQNRSLTDTFPIASKQDNAGILHFQNGDMFRIRVTNRGEKAAYFTILDIQPDHIVNVIVPAAQETPAEFRVRPGQTMELRRRFEVSPPAGVEMFKLIATDKPIDLRPIVQARGATTRANAEPLENLFGQTFFNEECLRHRGQTTNLDAGSIHIHSFIFIID